MKTTTTKDTTSTATRSSKTKSATAVKSKAAKSPVKKTTGGRTVKAKANAAEGLRDFFEDCLKDIYWAEKALTKALPKMAKNATAEELVNAIDEHLAVTEEHVARLEKVFQIIGKKAVAKKCEAMDGLIKEGQSIIEETEPGVVRDAGIIAASQKIEHYEIATYGTLCAFAKALGLYEAGEILIKTLEEEKQADMMLTEIAEAAINIEAAEENSEEK